VIAAEHDELARLERLDADRDPADPRRPPRREIGVGAVGRVGLDGDLVRRAAKPLADPGDRGSDAAGSPQRRRAAAEVDRYQLAGEPIGARVELAQDRLEVGVMRRWPDLDREVAVRAALAAPGEVEVDA